MEGPAAPPAEDVTLSFASALKLKRQNSGGLPPRPTASPAAKQRPAPAPAPPPAARAVQIRIASPVCAPRPHVAAHHAPRTHAHIAPVAVAGGTRLDFSSPPGAEKEKKPEVASPPRASVAALIASLGVFSPRPGVLVAPTMEVAASPAVELAAAECERAALAATLAARSETAAALSAQAEAQAAAAAALADAAQARARAAAAAEVADARAAALTSERDAAMAELHAAAEECAAVRAAMLTQEVAAENALFKADELAASLADAATARAEVVARAAAVRDTLRAALAALVAEPEAIDQPALRNNGRDSLAEAAALAQAVCFAAADAAAELATLRNTVANAGFGGAAAGPSAAMVSANASAPAIRVVARVRPARAGAAGGAWAAASPGGGADGGDVIATGGGSDSAPRRTFAVDRVLGPEATQEQVFAEVAPLVDAALKGQAACVFAFGQTASGKTHTMLGTGATDCADAGVLPRALAALFAPSQACAAVVITMLEVYNDSVRDLLAPGGAHTRLAIRHAGGGARAAPATELPARNLAEATATLARGTAARRAAPTAANAASSRSHLLVGLSLPSSGGRLWLVDLAGSERASASTSATSSATLPPALAACHSAPLLSYENSSRTAAAAELERSREGGCINRSLCALADCVAALARNAPHVPWRNSKLTELLSECLCGGAGRRGGSAVLIAHVSPAASDAAETAATLSFAERARGAAPRQARRASIDPKAERWRAAAAVAAAERDTALAVAKAAQETAAAATKRAAAADAAAAAARRDAAKARGLSMGTAAGAGGGGRPSLAAADVQAILTTPFGAPRSVRRAHAAATPAAPPALAAERSAPARLFFPATPGAFAVGARDDEGMDAAWPPLALDAAEPRSAVKAPRRPLGPASTNASVTEPAGDFDAHVKAVATRRGSDVSSERAASAPARRRSTGGAAARGLAMLSGASRVCITPGSRAAALMAAAAAPEKPQPKWNARW